MLDVFRRSLRNTLTGVIALLTTLAAGTIGFLAYQAASDGLERSALDHMQASIQSRELHVITVFKMRWTQLQEVGAPEALHVFLSSGKGDAPALVRDLRASRDLGDFQWLQVTDLVGKVVLSTEPEGTGTSLGNEAWFKKAVEKPTVGDLRRAGDEVVVRITAPIQDGVTGRTLGVLVSAARVNRLYLLLGDREGLGETGETYLMSASGQLLSPSRFTPNAEFSLRNTSGAYQNGVVKKSSAGGIWKNYLGEMVFGFTMFDDLKEALDVDWVLVAEIHTSEVLAPVYALRDRVAVLTLLVILLAALVAFFLSRSISQPVVALAEAARRVGEGDLRVEVRNAGLINEIGSLYDTFSLMRENLRAMLTNVQMGSAELATRTVQLGATAKEYAATSAEQASAVSQVSTTLSEIKETSRAAAESAAAVVHASEQAVENGARGLRAIAESVDTMGNIVERVEGIASKILKLSDQNVQIGEIVESVNDLAEQSNLLAVNASIEAAKAGEQGRGFAVVASEVRSLAEQSKRATQQIRAILAEVQKATESAVMATEEGAKRAGDGRRSIDSVRNVVEELAGVLEDSAAKARLIAGTATQQAAGIAQISEAIGAVAKAGQDSALGVRQLEQAVSGLSVMGAQLKTSADRYKV